MIKYLLLICIAGMVCSVWMLIRNSLVHSAQIRLIEYVYEQISWKRLREILTSESCESWLFRFWIPVSKLESNMKNKMAKVK